MEEALHFLASVKLARYFNSDSVIDGQEATKLEDTLAALLERLYALHPLLSDHYFSHQARIAPSLTQVELRL